MVGRGWGPGPGTGASPPSVPPWCALTRVPSTCSRARARREPGGLPDRWGVLPPPPVLRWVWTRPWGLSPASVAKQSAPQEESPLPLLQPPPSPPGVTPAPSSHIPLNREETEAQDHTAGGSSQRPLQLPARVSQKPWGLTQARSRETATCGTSRTTRNSPHPPWDSPGPTLHAPHWCATDTRLSCTASHVQGSCSRRTCVWSSVYNTQARCPRHPVWPAASAHAAQSPASHRLGAAGSQALGTAAPGSSRPVGGLAGKVGAGALPRTPCQASASPPATRSGGAGARGPSLARALRAPRRPHSLSPPHSPLQGRLCPRGRGGQPARGWPKSVLSR